MRFQTVIFKLRLHWGLFFSWTRIAKERVEKNLLIDSNQINFKLVGWMLYIYMYIYISSDFKW